MALQNEKTKKMINILFAAILALYPLRHIWLGVELTDSAYSAGNYRFLDNVNPMWFFSTYLANVTGRFLTGLPGGRLFMGLNFYTALFVSATAVAVYLFFTKTLRTSPYLAFFGELLAISLCWCPTTILYNYMTYFFCNLAVVVLYLGLVKERRRLLFAAGILLGINLFVRFPNLTEAALICSLWYYGWLQRKRLKDVAQETGVCLLGYLTGAGGIFALIILKYGWQEYVTGIVRLMQIPSEAADYNAFYMVLSVLLDYKFSAKWLLHMAVLVCLGSLASLLFRNASREGIGKREAFFGRAVFLGGILGLFRLWHKIGVFNIKYYTYESMFQWVAVFLLLVIIAGLYMLFFGKCTRNERLLFSMTLLLIAVTPLGSNNHLYPNMNNMFLVFPFGLSLFWRLLQNLREDDGEIEERTKFSFSLFPARAMLAAFLCAMSVQCLLFGAVFTFRDGMNGEKRDTKIEKNAILKGMVTNAPLAEALESLTAYVEAEELSDRSVILYGQIPIVSYLLDMPTAISTSWPDLRSYRYEVLAQDMEKLRNRPKEKKKPLFILGIGIEKWIKGEKLTEAEQKQYLINEKWRLLYEYMLEQGYEKTFENSMFAVYQG